MSSFSQSSAHSDISTATLQPFADVLVLEDDKITHGIVRKFLTQAGMRYHGVYSAEEAIAYLQENTPDLICSDIQLPGADGISFCTHIRKLGMTRDIPLIFFTGLSDTDTIGRAFDAGANDYVTKPLRKTEFLTRAKRQIEEYRKRKQANQKIQQLNDQNESKTKFLGVASHDLRNPLVSIRGIGQFLESSRFGDLNDAQKQMVRTIIDASESMLTLVEDLLDVSKMESDHLELKTEEIEVAALANSSQRLHSPTASRKSIEIIVNDGSEGARADLDPKLVSRVFDNLVTNAIKFSPLGTRIFLNLSADSETITIKVEDEGPGIPENEFNRLFREFSRTSNQPTAGESSSGIGLFVAKRIVNMHGGTISVANRPEGGACFQVEFQRI